ncbi:MAG: hypothetical protein ACLQQ4_04665 [Bacteroidia bacterium]
MTPAEKFQQECKEFDQQAQMVMDYEGAFGRCLSFLSMYRTPGLSIHLMEKCGLGKMIKDLKGINWPVDEVNMVTLTNSMFKHFAEKDEFDKCTILQQALNRPPISEPDEEGLSNFCYQVHVIYTFAANCQVMWEEYDGHQEWGTSNTGMFSFDVGLKLSDTNIDGIEIVTVLLNHFHNISRHDVCIDLKKLRDGLIWESQYKGGRSLGSRFEDGGKAWE